MKALSIRQPWAWLILNAGKDIENRDWPTGFRGRFLIHASKGMTRDEYENGLAIAEEINAEVQIPAFSQLKRGGIVGAATLIDCIRYSGSGFVSPWFFGEYGFELRDVAPLPFRPLKGALGFFDVPDPFPPSVIRCQLCDWSGPRIDLLDGEACPRCRLVL